MKYYHVLFLILILAGFSESCNPALTPRLVEVGDWQIAASTSQKSPCNNTDGYIPDTAHLGFWPIKYIQTNYHVIDRREQRMNLDTVDGPIKIWYIEDLANQKLDIPTPSLLPTDNPPATLPPRFRFRRKADPRDPTDDGVYFHYDDEIPWHVHTGKQQNIGNSAAFNRYAFHADSILNIFLISHHPDSIQSKYYKGKEAGVALGTRYVKLVDNWRTHSKAYPQHGNLIHEVGHIYTLGHTWAQNDGCDDTPLHANCWYYDYPKGCKEVSNNVMDYTAIAIALTPCQIGRVHAAMAKENTQQRKYLQPNWCKGLPGGDVELRDSLVLNHAVDLEGSLTLFPGAYLEVNCRLSIPEGKKILVHPGATLKISGKLHNSCELTWLGIELLEKRKIKGQLIWTAGASVTNTKLPFTNPESITSSKS